MSLDALHRRLIEVARQRVRSGEVTERGLARLCGVSQPHMHNALKEIRILSTPVADRLLQVLNLSIHELLWRHPGEEPGLRAVPVLRNRLGPGTHTDLSQFSGYLALSASVLSGVVQPVCARVGPDLVLPRAFAVDDVILLDQDPAKRSAPAGGGCWVVAGPTGLSVRYVRMGGGRVYLASEATAADPSKWESVLLGERGILGTVRARIVWLSRQIPAVGAN